MKVWEELCYYSTGRFGDWRQPILSCPLQCRELLTGCLCFVHFLALCGGMGDCLGYDRLRAGNRLFLARVNNLGIYNSTCNYFSGCSTWTVDSISESDIDSDQDIQTGQD